MKLKNLCALAFFALAVLACSKDDDKTTPEANAPTITGHTASGPVGSTLIINGTDFGAEIADNTVTLNGVSVTLSDANTIKLTGTVPAGAETGKIKVTTEGGTATSTEDFVVTVEETNQAPTITEGQVFSVKEDIDDAFEIGSVEANDEDGDNLIFSLVPGSDFFKISSSGLLSLQTGESLDYETATSHEITVEVSDGTETNQETITIVVENVIEDLFEDPDSFITRWKTQQGGNDEITIGTDPNLQYNYTINWGDGTEEVITSSDSPTHVYEVEGTYTVAINGNFPRIQVFGTPSTTRLVSIDQWGAIEWSSFHNAFRNCVNLEYTAADSPNLSNVTSLERMFQDATSFNGNLNNWDVSTIINMIYMFSGASAFNSDLDLWQLDSATHIGGMFQNATSFNGDVGTWDTSKLSLMGYIFSGAESFDQDLSSWDLSSAFTMAHMLDNSGLSPENYSNTLIGWQAQDNTPTGITLGAVGLFYCGTEAVTARALLTDMNDGYGWTINGDSECQL